MNETNTYKQDLIVYRINKAKETLEAARLLIENKFYTSAINRLYYACFYALIALFLKDGINAKSHNGVRTMLGKNYILTKILPEKSGEIFNDLFENRQSGDYDDIFDFDAEVVVQLFNDATYFIETILVQIEKE